MKKKSSVASKQLTPQLRKSMFQEYKELTRQEKKRNTRRFVSYVLKYRFYLLLILVSTTLMTLQASLVPKLTQLLIDDWLPKVPGLAISSEAVRVVVGIILGLIGLIFVKAFATFMSTYIIRKFQQNVEMDLKLKLFKKIQKLEINYYDKVNEGFFLSRMMNDTSMAAEYARFIPENILNVILSFGLNFTFIFTFSWIIGLSSFIVLISMFLLTMLMRPFFIRSWGRVRAKGDEFNQFLVNSFSGIRETKAYSSENSEIKKYEKVADDYKSVWRKNFMLYGKWMTSSATILAVMSISIIGLGSWQVIEGNMTIGELTALTMYGALIIEPINKLLVVFDLFMRGAVALGRIFKLLDEKEEQYGGKEIEINKGSIQFKNVHLKYTDDIHALKGVSFNIKPGEKVAFVGHTGSGKSTILKALVRFYEPNQGEIIIDGQKIKEYDVSSIRKKITLMSQEPYLFFDSVRKNIIFGSINVSDQDYKNAILSAQAEEFINSLPEGHQTNIGPRGVSLSGGQKQRVALARAILKKSNIILFDEATSALDNNTEKLIKKQVEILTKNKTVLYVAHRLTTIRNVDRIFVLENGQIKESGSHTELLAKRGKYYDLIEASNL